MNTEFSFLGLLFLGVVEKFIILHEVKVLFFFFFFYLWVCNMTDGCRWLPSSSPGDTLWLPCWRAPTSSSDVYPAPLWHSWRVWSVWRPLESVCTSHLWAQTNCVHGDLQEQSLKSLSFRGNNKLLQYPFQFQKKLTFLKPHRHSA